MKAPKTGSNQEITEFGAACKTKKSLGSIQLHEIRDPRWATASELEGADIQNKAIEARESIAQRNRPDRITNEERN